MDKGDRCNLNFLCAEIDPDLDEIKRRVLENPTLLYPRSLSSPIQLSAYHEFPLYNATITARSDEEKDLELIQFLIEEMLKLGNKSFNKGALLHKGSPDLYPLIALGWKNKFHVLEYLAKREPPILDHEDIGAVFFKCFYLFDNPGAIPKLLEIFPTYLRDDMDIEVLKRLVVHTARTANDIHTFQTVVQAGLRQNPDLERGVITGDVLQTLVTRKYILGLKYLRDYEPPLLRPSDVIELDLFSCFVKSLTHFTYSADVFLLLLELEPRAIASRTNGEHNNRYLPIHIFCELIMDKIESDDQFYRLLGMVLTLGNEYNVGSRDGVNGFSGIFEQCNGTIPAKTLYRYIGRIGESDEEGVRTDNTNRGSILETALMCETEVDWIHEKFLPNIIEDMRPELFRTTNRLGRFPLHYCITSRGMSFGNTMRILKGDEGIVDIEDPITGLLPSLLAASATPNYYINSKAQLSTTFELLRMLPIVPLRV